MAQCCRLPMQGNPSPMQRTYLPMQETQEMQVQSLGWEDLLEEEMANTSVFLPGKFHGQSLAGYSPWGCKESDITENTYTNTHTQRHDCSTVIKVIYTKVI